MSASLQLSRNTHVFLEKDSTIWKLPVLDGYSFSQATDSTEVTLSEMAGTAGDSRRGRAIFNNAISPAEWSFSTYTRPTGTQSVEEPLWASFINAGTYSAGAWGDATSVVRGVNSVGYNMLNSNVVELPTFNLYFVLGACGPTAAGDYSPANGQTIYKIAGCVAGSAEISFDIDGITMIAWSGNGTLISEEASFNGSAAITTGIDSTSNFIRNRLTSLSVAPNGLSQDGIVGNEFAASYNVVLTGGNITFENNITFLTPEELCRVNQPIGHILGARSISGSFTCYLNPVTGASADLFDDLITATNTVTNSFALVFSVGGASAPKVVFNIPQAHIEIPNHSIEDVISLETSFHALPSDLDSANEISITYHSA